MPTKKHGIIIETPGEARQAERGPLVLALLTISTALAAHQQTSARLLSVEWGLSCPVDKRDGWFGSRVCVAFTPLPLFASQGSRRRPLVTFRQLRDVI